MEGPGVRVCPNAMPPGGRAKEPQAGLQPESDTADMAGTHRRPHTRLAANIGSLVT